MLYTEVTKPPDYNNQVVTGDQPELTHDSKYLTDLKRHSTLEPETSVKITQSKPKTITGQMIVFRCSPQN